MRKLVSAAHATYMDCRWRTRSRWLGLPRLAFYSAFSSLPQQSPTAVSRSSAAVVPQQCRRSLPQESRSSAAAVFRSSVAGREPGKGRFDFKGEKSPRNGT